MASADELRTRIETNRAALKAAIEAAGPRWEQSPGGEEWAPRRVAEHAIGAERAFGGWIATAMQGRPPEQQQLALAAPAEAAAALEAAAADFTRVVRYVEDRDLAKVADHPTPYPKTVEGVLQLSADHLDNHAKQIRAAIGS